MKREPSSSWKAPQDIGFGQRLGGGARGAVCSILHLSKLLRNKTVNFDCGNTNY